MSTSGRGPAAVSRIRHPWEGTWFVAIMAVVLAISATAITAWRAQATVDTHTAQGAALAELLTSYDPATGLIGSAWWQSATALSTVETYAEVTGDTSYDSLIARAFALNSRGKFENSSDDDTEWWGLAWLQAYDLTHVPAYLLMAETDADYVHEDWDGTCGGGIWWHRDPRSYKNAITNELFLDLTAWLHNTIHGDTKYLAWARAEWSWFDHSGMINTSNLVNDGLDSSCVNNGEPTWTYNQGVILAGLARLYQATGNRQLLTEGERIGRAAVRHLTVDGVLTEPCQGPGCQAKVDPDAQAFKGIFVQDLKVFAVTAGTTEFNAFFLRQARSIEAHDMNADHQIGLSWAGPVTDSTAASQASGLAALVAALELP